VVYLGGWFLGYWSGNFSLLLFLLTVVTLAYWLAERFASSRRAKPPPSRWSSRTPCAPRRPGQDGHRQGRRRRRQAQRKLLMQPWWLDWTAGLFPVILIVFLLRSFLFEPFKIPSGSMVPTLMVGDLILVNKFHYGVRLPVLNKKIVANNDPQRGDVMVFRYPVDPQSRLHQARGRRARRRGGLAEPAAARQRPGSADQSAGRVLRRRQPALRADVQRKLGRSNIASWSIPSAGLLRRRAKDLCLPRELPLHPEGVVCKVPPGHYFMMGDNRDNSQDSRFWGFVPDENIVGKAFFVWMNFGNLGRIGAFN
jgi:signal peptidase I